MKRISTLIVLMVVLLSSCKKEDINLPDTNDEEYISNCEAIAKQADEIIEAAIQKAYNEETEIDPNEIANELTELDLVKSATPSESGISISIELMDGSWSNVLLVPRDEDRMFIIDSSQVTSVTNTIPTEGISIIKGSLERPKGDKALLLSPFQNQFNDKLNDIVSSLSSIGYKVTTVIDQAADLDYFRCDTLQKYDVIIVSTHGIYARNRKNELTTLLITGERINIGTLSKMSADEKLAIASVSVKGKSYFAASVQWLELTKNGEFPTSWFCANACETSKSGYGSSSLSAFLLNNGVGGFTGYKESIPNPIAISVIEQLLGYMTRGDALKVATNKIKTDNKFKIAVLLRLAFESQSYEVIDYLDAQVSSNEPFYITKANPFPYNHCRFNFFSKASYSNSETGSYDFAFSREVEAFGNLNGNKFVGSYTGTNGDTETNETIEISLDLTNHRVTEFTITGSDYISDENHSEWSIKSSETDFQLNDINRYGYATDISVGEFVGDIDYVSVYPSGENSVSETLTGITYYEGSNLEIEFSELEEN